MKSRNNRTLIIVIVLAVLLFVYLYVRKRNNKEIVPITPDDGDNGSQDTDGGSDEKLFTDDSFPLEHGSGGENVRILQKSIRKAGGKLPEFGVDGKFGDETEQALKDLGYSTVVTESVFDDILYDAQAKDSGVLNDLTWW